MKVLRLFWWWKDPLDQFQSVFTLLLFQQHRLQRISLPYLELLPHRIPYKITPSRQPRDFIFVPLPFPLPRSGSVIVRVPVKQVILGTVSMPFVEMLHYEASEVSNGILVDLVDERDKLPCVALVVDTATPYLLENL